MACTGLHAQTRHVIVAENFSDDTTSLNGLVADTFSPDIVAAGGSNLWAANAQFRRNGAVNSGTANRSASLDIGNYVNNAKGSAAGKFELTLTISEVSGTSGSWISLGFAAEETPATTAKFDNTDNLGTTGLGTIIYRAITDPLTATSGELDMFGGPENTNAVDGPDGNSGPRTLTVILDLTPAGGYNGLNHFGTVTWRDSQTPTALGSYTYTIPTSFGSLLISKSTAATTGTISALTLTQLRPYQIIDSDGDGMCDVWEIHYNAQGLDPTLDTDGDGMTNREESVAGTHPRDPNSRLKAELRERVGNDLLVRADTQPGKRYSIQHSDSLTDGSWLTLPGSVVASGSEHLFTVPVPAADKGFYRVAVNEQNTDNDGASDWVERQLGYNPDNPNSFGTPQNDLAGVMDWISQLQAGNFTAEVTVPVATEKEGTLASITYARSGDLARPFTFFFNTSGIEDDTKSSALPGSWRFKDVAGVELTGGLTIPAGVDSVVLKVEAISNILPEVPRLLSIGANGSSTRTTVTLADAENTIANQRLLVASLTPGNGIETLGSGQATIRLQGDNDASVIAVNFSNLSSPTTNTQLQTLSGLILQSIPPSQYTGREWLIRATQAFATDQAVLDALLSGSLQLKVFSEMHPQGEIAGQFQVVNGSPDFEEPPAAEPVATLTGAELDRDIARFLSQATAGPTTADIDSLRAAINAKNGDRIAAYSEWIDAQIALPTTLMLPYAKAADDQRDFLLTKEATLYGGRNTRHGYWLLLRHAPDQLRKRVSFALHQILVTSMANPAVKNYSQGAANYFDTLQAGAFGDYSALLNSVSLHPIMGEYLSHLKNQKELRDSNGNIVAFPDENYAREIMQLFSIGLFELHPDGTLKLDASGLPIPTYTQTDIAELARVFTGLSYSRYTPSTSPNQNLPNTTDPLKPLTTGFFRPERNPQYTRSNAAYVNPMTFFDEYRDTGSKSWLGITIPAGLTGPQNLDTVHNRLATHPSTAPFIATRLIQRMVTANPSRGYVYRVASAFANGSGNLNNAIRAILLDPEARNPEVINSSVSVGRVRDPILRYMAFLRAFDVKSQLELADLTTYGYPASELAKFPAGTPRLRLRELDSLIEQSPYLAPSVFNWYRPDYSPPAGPLAENGLVSPELQIHNEFTTFAQNNLFWTLINSTNGEAGEPIETPNGAPTEDPPIPPSIDPHASKYTSLSDNLILNLAPLEAFYMSVVDTDRNGSFTAADGATFNNPAAIRQACAAVLDHVDLLLCAGSLQTTATQTRTYILDAAQATNAETNNSSNAATQSDNMKRRIRSMLWLVTSSPTYTVTQ
jgi:uncharacterized protein (DUF1800 family)